ncbi:MAG: flagellar export chaperone FliS [Nitrospirae bacterium]|nr:flagellar export chaperone FliS [Nitrospirota bacterium]
MANPYTQQYAQVQASTVSQERLLVLLYEGAIKFLGQARESLGENRLSRGKTALSKAMAIIAELQNSLDLKAGWSGAEDLYHLYGYMTLELTQANLKGELERIDQVRDLLGGLCDAWRQAIESQEREAVASRVPGAASLTGERTRFRASV